MAQYTIVGNRTSAEVTAGLNNNFDELYARTNKSYIIEEGTSGDWHYRIHYQPNTGVGETSAMLEMWLQKEYTYNQLNVSTMWGTNNWRVADFPIVSYPNVGVTITEPPTEIVQITCEFGGLFGSNVSGSLNTNSQTGNYSIIRPFSEAQPSATSKARINYYVTYCFNL